MKNRSELTTPKQPHRVKITEQNRINPTYINLTQGEEFKPNKEVVYLWVYNAKKELVVGIEKPWEYPQAFNIDVNDETQMILWEKISLQLQTLLVSMDRHLGFGHPTLSTEFDETGDVEVGSAYLGGELRYEEGEWIIDNKSGRFGRYEEDNPVIQQHIENTIHEVRNTFQKAGIIVVPQIDFEDPRTQSPMHAKETQNRRIKRFTDEMGERSNQTKQKVIEKSEETLEQIEKKLNY